MEFLTMVLGAGAFLYTARRCFPGLAFAMIHDGDEDMKIVDGSFSSAAVEEDSAQKEAELYLKQKSAGNIEKARALGERYAAELLRRAEALQSAELRRAHHRLLLFSYVVNRVIADFAPNSILAQTALNVFYDYIEDRNSEASAHIRDMAAFSLYILVNRSDKREDGEIGRIYAQLCGAEGVADVIEEGNNLFAADYEACRLELERTAFDPV